MTHTRGRAASERPASSGRVFEFTIDRDWRLASISEGAADWFGFAPDDVVGRDSGEVMPGASGSVIAAIEGALADGASSVLEIASLAIPGRWVQVEIDPTGDGVRLRFEDITSRIMFGQGSADIVLLDRNGVIVAANAAWRAGAVAAGLKFADAGVGARYAAVAAAMVVKTDEATLQGRLEELFAGRLQEFEATFSQPGPNHSQRRQVRITPLRTGDAPYFLAIHEDLAERAKVLAALSATTDQPHDAQAKERERIAIELHDTIGQNQAGLLMGLAQLRKYLGQNPAAEAVLDDMSTLVQENIHHRRMLSHLMNASGVKPAGLEASLRRFVVGFGRRSGLRVTFKALGALDAISAAVEHAVLRLAQEAMSNVYRHARARKVSVKLVCRTGVLTISVADDGRGFLPAPGVHAAEPPCGVGITGMRSRIEQLGGTLEIVGRASGTCVTASVPLPSATAD